MRRGRIGISRRADGPERLSTCHLHTLVETWRMFLEMRVIVDPRAVMAPDIDCIATRLAHEQLFNRTAPLPR